jgi:hypothetical protein
MSVVPIIRDPPRALVRIISSRSLKVATHPYFSSPDRTVPSTGIVIALARENRFVIAVVLVTELLTVEDPDR